MLAKTEVIIPRRDNDGSDNSPIIQTAIARMCELFGGVTVFEAKGYWISDVSGFMADDVAVLQSAKIQSSETREALRTLAKMVLDSTDQEAVFISDADGAEIVER